MSLPNFSLAFAALNSDISGIEVSGLASKTKMGVGDYQIVVPLSTGDDTPMRLTPTEPGGAFGIDVVRQGSGADGVIYRVFTSDALGAAADCGFWVDWFPFDANDGTDTVRPHLALIQGYASIDSAGGAFNANQGFAEFGSGSVINGVGDWTLQLLEGVSVANRTFSVVIRPSGFASINRRLIVEPVSTTDYRVRIFTTPGLVATDEDFSICIGKKRIT
jgi:hypothetical protein